MLFLVVLTDEFLKEFVIEFVDYQEDLENALSIAKKDVEKLWQKYPDDPGKQIFNMIRDKMKIINIQDREKMVR